MGGIRRCFITGQQCTQTCQIEQNKRENQMGRTVSVFVVMSYSSLSLALYDFIMEQLKDMILKHCYRDKKGDILAKEELSNKHQGRVNHVIFERADISASTGYVVCDRVCQMIQSADIIVVDVSHDNPNVFYELGIAMALKKTVIPICFTREYYQKREAAAGEDSLRDDTLIDNFPWKKRLYESFSLRAYEPQLSKHYRPLNKSPDREMYEGFGFRDDAQRIYTSDLIYLLLADGMEDRPPADNENTKAVCSAKDTATLLTYAELGFSEPLFVTVLMNVKKLADAIGNPELFHGDRTLILAQSIKLYEANKERKDGRPTSYKVADLILNGTNAALEKTQHEKAYIQSDRNIVSTQRAFLAYPESPVFMERISTARHRELEFLIQPIQQKVITEGENIGSRLSQLRKYLAGKGDPWKEPLIKLLTQKNKGLTGVLEWQTPVYTYLNVLISYMRYADQVIIDTHRNGVEAYFWLGVCHASNVDTVRVERVYSGEDEKLKENQQKGSNHSEYYHTSRPVFDVAGLWCALIGTAQIKPFFEELYQVQIGILKHRHAYARLGEHVKDMASTIYPMIDHTKDEIKGEMESKLDLMKKTKERICEEYYRHQFWNAMCDLDFLNVVLGAPNPPTSTERDQNIKWEIGAWDIQTASLLTEQLTSYRKTNHYEICIVTPPGNGDLNQKDETNINTSASPACNRIFVGDGTVNTKCKVFSDQYAKPREPLSREKEDPEPGEKNCSASLRRLSIGGVKIRWKQPCEKCLACRESNSDCPFADGGSNTSVTYKQYGSLVLEKCKNGNNVYLMGGSGTATYAMASMFTAPALRKAKPYFQDEKEENALSYLQKKLRDMFLAKGIEKVKGKLGEVFGNEEESSRALEQVRAYLDITLSRYFLPFLSSAEIAGIQSGLWFYLQELTNRKTREEKNGSTDDPEKNLIDSINEHNENKDEISAFMISSVMEPFQKDVRIQVLVEIAVHQQIRSNLQYMKSIKSLQSTIGRSDENEPISPLCWLEEATPGQP